MKKSIAVLVAFFLAGTTLAVAATAKSAGQIKNTKIVQAANQDLTLNYFGTPIFVPKGQTIILGQRPNGSIVIRGLNMNGIKVGSGTFSTEGYSVVSYQPQSDMIFLNRGAELTLTDPHGEKFTVKEKGAILTTNAKINSDTVKELVQEGQKDAIQAAADLQNDEDIALLADGIGEDLAAQQSVQDVEDTLSPSAPR